MTIVKINAITVPVDSGDELARRFAAHAGAVDDQPASKASSYSNRPTSATPGWSLPAGTRWADDESFQAWVSSPAFGHGRRREADPSGPPAAPHVGMSSELWSYEIAGGSSL